ncbi:hypothetical protein L0Z72_06075, partial [candidate division KSB1 bacterium]|nr:hypothetical protein [candidate division KSB1 bacterium]
MKHKLSFGMGILIMCAAVIININSCSVIGLGIGSISDASQTDQTDISVSQLKTMASGISIIIKLKDTNQLSGKFVGSEMIPVEEYAKLYSQACEAIKEIAYLPALGDSFNLLSNETASFLGFDFDRMLFKGKKGNIIGGSITNIDTLTDSNGNMIDIEIAKKLIAEGKIPLVSAIHIKDATETKQIRLDRIETIQIPTRKNGKLTGFLIGAIIDVLIILSISSAFQNF